jgi:hypothetical protein
MAMNFSESAKSGIRSTQALNAGVGPKDRQTIALIDLAIQTEKNTPTNPSGSGLSLTDRRDSCSGVSWVWLNRFHGRSGQWTISILGRQRCQSHCHGHVKIGCSVVLAAAMSLYVTASFHWTIFGIAERSSKVLEQFVRRITFRLVSNCLLLFLCRSAFVPLFSATDHRLFFSRTSFADDRYSICVTNRLNQQRHCMDLEEYSSVDDLCSVPASLRHVSLRTQVDCV